VIGTATDEPTTVEEAVVARFTAMIDALYVPDAGLQCASTASVCGSCPARGVV
jgi:hypothetical protein